jgi:hypothetical protein
MGKLEFVDQDSSEYDGLVGSPIIWTVTDSRKTILENFHDSFAVQADLTNLIEGLRPRIGKAGTVSFRMDYEIIILFGLTEFKAQLAWKENVSYLDFYIFTTDRKPFFKGVEKR